jgi:hypothetical protein
MDRDGLGMELRHRLVEARADLGRRPAIGGDRQSLVAES